MSVFINACRLLSVLPSLSQFGRRRLSHRDYILRAVGTFWAMSLVGIYPGRAFMWPALFGLPLRMNGMHRRQSGHVHVDLLSLEILSVCFDHLSHENYTKQCWSKSISLSPILRNLRLLLLVLE